MLDKTAFFDILSSLTVRNSSQQNDEANERSHTMGDKGGKKDKDKGQKQKLTQKDQKEKNKKDKQPKRKP
jgi:hypothetical protein